MNAEDREMLTRIMEFAEEVMPDVDPEKVFTLNERKKFKIIDIDKEGRRILCRHSISRRTPHPHCVLAC